MSQEASCCAGDRRATELARTCPVSGLRGQQVERRTPEHLLVDPARLGTGPFYFCSDPDCDAVYFDGNGEDVYYTRDLKVRVGLKVKEDPIPLCYCFGFDRAMIRDEIEKTGATSIPGRIKDEVAAGNCACEIKNPQGSCCLGSVNTAAHTIQAEIKRERDDRNQDE